MTNDAIKETAEEARAEYDLDARLRNIPKRKEDGFIVYTDEITGEALGYAKDIEAEKNQIGITIVPGYRARAGLVGKLDELETAGEPDTKAIAKLKKEIAALRAALKATAFSFVLAAVPPIVNDVAKREAKKRAGIKGKITEDKISDYSDEYTAIIFSKVMTSFTDLQNGAVVSPVTAGQAKSFKSYLPESEYGRLVHKINELQFKATIDESATADADF